MVSKICMNTYTFVCSANLQIDAPYKWLQKFSVFPRWPCWGNSGTLLHFSLCLFSKFLLLSQLLFSIFLTPSLPLPCFFQEFCFRTHACICTHHHPTSFWAVGRGGGEAKSWAFWELVFYFFKSLSGLVVCMADSLDLIPGLIQSLFQISLVHHAMPWHSSDAPVYIISGQIYARLNVKSYSLGGKKSLTLLLTIKAGNPMSKKKNCLTKLLRRLLNMNLYSFLFHSIYIFNPCFGKWNLLWCKPRFDAVMGFSFPWASPNLVF